MSAVLVMSCIRTSAVRSVLRKCVSLVAGAVKSTVCVDAVLCTSSVVDQTFILIWRERRELNLKVLLKIKLYKGAQYIYCETNFHF